MIKPRSLPSHFELESEAKERNISEFIPSSVFSNFQPMLPGLEHPVLPTGNLVTPQLSEKGTMPVRKDIPNSFPWCNTTFHFISSVEEINPCYQRCSTKKIFSIKGSKHWNSVESSGRSFQTLNSMLVISFQSINCMVIIKTDTHIV